MSWHAITVLCPQIYQAEAKNVYLNEMHIFMQSDSQGIMFFQQ